MLSAGTEHGYLPWSVPGSSEYFCISVIFGLRKRSWCIFARRILSPGQPILLDPPPGRGGIRHVSSVSISWSVRFYRLYQCIGIPWLSRSRTGKGGWPAAVHNWTFSVTTANARECRFILYPVRFAPFSSWSASLFPVGAGDCDRSCKVPQNIWKSGTEFPRAIFPGTRFGFWRLLEEVGGIGSKCGTIFGYRGKLDG